MDKKYPWKLFMCAKISLILFIFWPLTLAVVVFLCLRHWCLLRCFYPHALFDISLMATDDDCVMIPCKTLLLPFLSVFSLHSCVMWISCVFLCVCLRGSASRRHTWGSSSHLPCRTSTSALLPDRFSSRCVKQASRPLKYFWTLRPLWFFPVLIRDFFVLTLVC